MSRSMVFVWVLFFVGFNAQSDVILVPLFDSQIEKKPIPEPKERASGKFSIHVSSYAPRDLNLPTRSGQTASRFKRKDLPMLQFQSFLEPWEFLFSDSQALISPFLGFSLLRLERQGVLTASAGGLRTEQNAILLGTVFGGEARWEWMKSLRWNSFVKIGIQPTWVFAQKTAISIEQNRVAFPLYGSLGLGVPLFFKTEGVFAFETLQLTGGTETNVNGWGFSGGIQFRL